MNMQDVRTITGQYLIDASGLAKKEIVHKLQRQEGNFYCCTVACDGQCDQLGRRWREDCFRAAGALCLRGRVHDDAQGVQ